MYNHEEGVPDDPASTYFHTDMLLTLVVSTTVVNNSAFENTADVAMFVPISVKDVETTSILTEELMDEFVLL